MTSTLQTQTEFSINQRFSFLEDLTSMVVTGITPSLVVTGPGGNGKTSTVSKVIDTTLDSSAYITFKGYSTSRGLYNTLYDNNGKLIIFDDCDSVLEDKVSLNILKSALDSYDKRTISWMAKMNKNDVYPSQFDFTGRIIFISNKEGKNIDGAIRSRSLMVDLTMSPSEKIERLSYILGDILPDYSMDIKLESLGFLDSIKDSYDINIRTFIMVSKMRRSFPDTWMNLAHYMLSQ
jgi:Cdc6-like AAA superfamily ATPase